MYLPLFKNALVNTIEENIPQTEQECPLKDNSDTDAPEAKKVLIHGYVYLYFQWYFQYVY